MCGICGFNWEDNDLVKSMTKILEHRGPDGEGTYIDNNISLGHRRLSIIDLSKAGKQPMCNEDNNLWITYNGEIYNFKELRVELEKHGHRFKSDTDTEVVIHAYEQWGKECLNRFNGMFAFAIWDSDKKELFIARDRLGIKPLYYYWDKKENKLIFASEIKAILLAGVKRETNLRAARNYLNLRYIPGEETLFKGINKLLPGHYLVFGSKEIKTKQFWDVPLPVVNNDSLQNCARKVKEIFTDSIKKRLVADVPVGVYLSGGIDSAAITGIASELKNEPIKTFSVGFDYNNEVDELQQARKVSNHFNTDHTEIVVKDRIGNLLPKLIWQLDQPHGDPVIIPQFMLSKTAKDKVKVVLSGEGADEMFAGYVQYKNYLFAQKIKHFPLKSTMAKIVPVSLFDKFFDYPSSMGEKGKEKVIDFLSDLKNSEKSYNDLITILSNKDNQLLFDKEFPKEVGAEKFNDLIKPLLNKLLYYDTKKWLPNYVLYINDRMTMANSIEGRVPFLDHKLVNYATTIPSNFKLGNNITKLVLRESIKKVLPEPDIKKHAFFMPLDNWFKDELKPLAEELFSPSNVKKRGYFDHHQLKKVWENYYKSKLIYGKQLFTLINFELWHRMFIDNETVPLNSEIKLESLR